MSRIKITRFEWYFYRWMKTQLKCLDRIPLPSRFRASADDLTRVSAGSSTLGPNSPQVVTDGGALRILAGSFRVLRRQVRVTVWIESSYTCNLLSKHISYHISHKDYHHSSPYSAYIFVVPLLAVSPLSLRANFLLYTDLSDGCWTTCSRDRRPGGC